MPSVSTAQVVRSRSARVANPMPRTAGAIQYAATAGNAAELIAAMQKAYPKAGLGVALDIGAKVNKGEMKW